MMVPSSKSPLASDTESVCLLLLISFLIHRWAWRMRKNWKQIGGFQENEPLCFLISNPYPRANFSGYSISVYTLVHICYGAKSLWLANEIRISLSFSQAFLPFVKKSLVFLVDFVFIVWCSSEASILPVLWLISNAALAFKNFCDSKQRNSSI